MGNSETTPTHTTDAPPSTDILSMTDIQTETMHIQSSPPILEEMCDYLLDSTSPRMLERMQNFCRRLIEDGTNDTVILRACDCYLSVGTDGNATSSPTDYPDIIEKVDISRESKLVLTILYGIIIAFSGVGNILAICVFILNKSLHNMTNVFLLSVTFSDLIMTVFCMPVNALLINRGSWDFGDFSEVGCKLVPYMQTLGVSANIVSLIFIAFARFVAVLFPLKTKNYSQTQYLAFSNLVSYFIWIFAAVFAIPNALWFEYSSFNEFMDALPSTWSGTLKPPALDSPSVCKIQEKHMDDFDIYRLCILVLLFCVPCLITTLLYATICWHLWSRKKVHNQVVTFDQLRIRTYKRVTIMLIMIQSLFIICWAPTMIYETVIALNDTDITETTLNLRYYFQWLAMLNSCVNPIVYVFMHEKFRKTILCKAGSAASKRNRIAPEVPKTGEQRLSTTGMTTGPNQTGSTTKTTSTCATLGQSTLTEEVESKDLQREATYSKCL